MLLVVFRMLSQGKRRSKVFLECRSVGMPLSHEMLTTGRV
jgi:hypothetical protein